MTLMTTCTISSCSDESFDENSNGCGKLKFEAILPGSNGTSTRTVYVQDQYGKLKSGWDSNDRINVYGFTSGTKTFTNPDIDDSSDDVSRWSNSEAVYQRGENLVAVYPALPIDNDGIVEMDFSNQDGTLENLKNYDLMVSDKVPYEQAEVKFQMIRKNVFLRISINESEIENKNGDISIVLHGKNGLNKVSYNITNRNWNINRNSNENSNEIIVNCANTISPIDSMFNYYIAIPGKAGEALIDMITVKKGNVVIKKMEYSEDKVKFIPGHIYSTELKNEITTAYLAHGGEGKGIVGYDGPYVNSAIISQVKDQNPDNLRKITFVANSKMQSTVNIRYPDSNVNPSFENGIYVIPQNDSTEILICTPADKIITSNVPAGMFKGFKNLEYIDNLSMLCTDGASIIPGSREEARTRDMSEMFMNCHSLKNIDLTSFNTSFVANFNSMFEGCSSLTSLDLSSFDTSESIPIWLPAIMGGDFVIYKHMNKMFADCTNLQELNLGMNFDLSKFYYQKIFSWGLNIFDYINEAFDNTFANTNSIKIIANQDVKNRMTRLYEYDNNSNPMKLTNKTITWINSETGQPLQ